MTEQNAAFELLEKRIADLPPALYGTCPADLTINALLTRVKEARGEPGASASAERQRQAEAEWQQYEKRRAELEHELEQQQEEHRRIERQRKEAERRQAIARERERALEHEKATRAAAERHRQNINAKPWPKDIKQHVLAKSVVVGMTKEQAIAAWGRPERINETLTATTRHEQWVYGSGYLYFTNGVLTAIQTSR